jgi:hypothetical protein
MKKRIALLMLIALVATLLASSMSSAQSNRPGAVTTPVASGGRYRLTVTTWRVSGSAHGGGYRLQGPARPALTGNGCCCTYLPCVIRQ